MLTSGFTRTDSQSLVAESDFEDILSGILRLESEESPESEFLFLSTEGNVSYFTIDNYLQGTATCTDKLTSDKKCPKNKTARVEPMIAVFIPSSFDPFKPADLLFFFHGFLIDKPGMLDKDKLRSPSVKDLLQFRQHGKDYFNLPRVVESSCTNTILVIPTLGPRGQAGALTKQETWTKFRSNLLERIQKDILDSRGIKSFVPGRTILAAHSGGGKILRAIAQFDAPSEVWGFDAHYGGDADWKSLAAKYPATPFHFYDHPHGSGTSHKIKMATAAYLRSASKRNKNITVHHSLENHFDMILPKFRERIEKSTTAMNKACIDQRYQGKPTGGLPYYHHNPGKTNLPRLAPVQFENTSLLEELFLENELNQEAPVSDTSALVGDKFPDQMLYLNIPIGLSKTKPQTAVFIPKAFDPRKPVDLLVYFHGYLYEYPGNNKPIRDYLNYKDCGFNCINLREEIERSGKNVLLIAPTLGNKSESGTLTHRGQLDVYLDHVKAGFAEHWLKPKFGVDKLKKGKLILAGHSGGGAILAALAAQILRSDSLLKKATQLYKQVELLKTKGSPFGRTKKKADKMSADATIMYRANEFWGFDSIYGGGATWLKLTRTLPHIRAFMFYNPDGHKSKDATFRLLHTEKSKATKGELDSLVLFNAKGNTERNGHYKIISPSLRERLADLSVSGDGMDWEYGVMRETPEGLKKKLKSKAYRQWIQYALNQALGKRMETDGKLEKIKKALEEFRKLKNLTGTGDFDVEAEAALLTLNIHRPEHFMNSCIHSVIGEKNVSSPILSQMVSIAEAEYLAWGSGTTKETDASIQPKLKSYWKDTVDNLYGYNHNKAWSAVFISWVVLKAGGANYFPIDDAHSTYTFYSKLNRARPGMYFRAYRAFEVKPGRGDIVVRAREGSGANYDKLSPDVIKTHGQIVVDVQSDHIIAIGGNEARTGHGTAGVTVNRRKIKLGADGFLPCNAAQFAVIRLDTITPEIPELYPGFRSYYGTRIGPLELEIFNPAAREAKERLMQMMTSRLGKCPVNPDDMVSLVSPAYAQAVFGSGGPLEAFLMKEVDFVTGLAKGFPAAMDESLKRLLAQLELHFIHDPSASSLDLLPAELSKEYRGFNWDHDDYPGNKNKTTQRRGRNQAKAETMHGELKLIRPERRPNSTSDKVMSPAQFCLNKKYIMRLCGGKLMSYARQSFDSVLQAAKQDGVTITVDNDFRYSECANGTVKRTSSNPNTKAVGTFSSHMMGLAVDLNLSFGTKTFVEVTTRPFKQVIEMRTSPIHKWMFLKGARYGWFPLTPEPWHWEYNPVGFRELFWKDLEAAKPKRRKNRKQKEFETDILSELLSEIEYEFDVSAVDKNFLIGKTPGAILKKEFVSVPDGFIKAGSMKPVRLLKKVRKAYIDMYEKARKGGIELKLISGYRSFEYQRDKIWDKKWKGEKEVVVNRERKLLKGIMTDETRALAILGESAMPGTSRHHWGTDIDIVSTDSRFFDTPEGQRIYSWMQANAPKFGFCQPYDKKGSPGGRIEGYNEEKWHWSFTEISKPLLAKYGQNVSVCDISPFEGERTAVSLDVIEKYVKAIAPSCKP